MQISVRDQEVVQGVFDAMQMGPAGEDEMMALFAPNAVMVEPFTGQMETHVGKEAIHRRFKAMNEEENAPHDLRLAIDRMDLTGSQILVDWTCTSAMFKTPMEGYDVFEIRDGLIERFEIHVRQWPDMEVQH